MKVIDMTVVVLSASIMSDCNQARWLVRGTTPTNGRQHTTSLANSTSTSASVHGAGGVVPALVPPVDDEAHGIGLAAATNEKAGGNSASD